MKSSEHISKLADSELLHLFRIDGDGSFIGELYRRYSHLVFGVCLKYLKNKEDARDALLSVFEKLITDLNRYEITEFQHWIYSVSKHHCLNKLRENGKYSSIEIDSQRIEDVIPNDYSGEFSAAQEKERMLINLESAIDDLSNEQKTCVTMFYLEKQSYRMIAEVTGMTLNEIKSHIQNGRRNLSLVLKEQS